VGEWFRWFPGASNDAPNTWLVKAIHQPFSEPPPLGEDVANG